MKNKKDSEARLKELQTLREIAGRSSDRVLLAQRITKLKKQLAEAQGAATELAGQESEESNAESMSLTAIAAESGVPEEEILADVKRGELPATNVGTPAIPKWRVIRSDFVKFLNRRSHRRTTMIGKRLYKGLDHSTRSQQIMGAQE